MQRPPFIRDGSILRLRIRIRYKPPKHLPGLNKRNFPDQAAVSRIIRRRQAVRGNSFVDDDHVEAFVLPLRQQIAHHRRLKNGLDSSSFDLYWIVFQSDHAIRRAGDFRLA